MRQVTLKELKQIALDSKYSIWADAQNCGRDVKLYLHWSAGRYDTCFDDYHVNITGDGKIFVYPVEKVVKIRTGEEDFAALQDVE